MDSLSYKTAHLNKATIDKGWVVLDAQTQVLGRFASKVAMIIRGKHKASYTPNVDCGDNVIVINSDKIRLTGKKWDDKVYISHTGHPGGQRFTTPRKIAEKKTSKVIIEKAVKGMLPKNRLGRALFNNLYIYEGAEHPHAAQNPKSIKL
ncbi:MAG: 50S ribosomal protein L13 [Cytophagaceae bacterium]